MDKNVIVYSTPQCPWCLRLKQYLDEKKVRYKAIDVLIDPYQSEKMVGKSGQTSVPQIWVGDEIIIGFDREKIDKILELK
ncbi:MAG: glutaredoxin domain-containing protein [bacterium]|nr:glutaredoxin domain-containing protein [bacterium]